MFCKNGRKKELYEGIYKPLITDWQIMRKVEGSEPFEVDSDLVERIRSMPFTDIPGIEFTRFYPCIIKGRVFGHNTYPYANGTEITTTEIDSVSVLNGNTDVVLARTRSGAFYYLSIK